MTERCSILEPDGEQCEGFSEYLLEPLDGDVPCQLRACGDAEHLLRAVDQVANTTGYPAVVTGVVCGY